MFLYRGGCCRSTCVLFWSCFQRLEIILNLYRLDLFFSFVPYLKRYCFCIVFVLCDFPVFTWKKKKLLTAPYTEPRRTYRCAEFIRFGLDFIMFGPVFLMRGLYGGEHSKLRSFEFIRFGLDFIMFGPVFLMRGSGVAQ